LLTEILAPKSIFGEFFRGTEDEKTSKLKFPVNIFTYLMRFSVKMINKIYPIDKNFVFIPKTNQKSVQSGPRSTEILLEGQY
jgi:hypothetical protein